jgi:predicted nucleotide-binding protein (sugar kinase/HSP70/actin superfamily)
MIGEFWAMTTEGDGNYKMQAFLEQEGAEVDIQTVTAWLLYMLWEAKFDIKRRLDLPKDDDGLYGLAGSKPWKSLALIATGDVAVRAIFHFWANIMGLSGYHLPDMDKIADIGHQFYDNAARGGEGHMEVAKLILNVAHQKVNMTLSVKPFGCMPSSGVSDGVQTLVTTLHPSAIFLPIETSGDGAVNVQSRVQMMLFKARQSAAKELDEALAKTGLDREAIKAAMGKNALWYAPHKVASSAANVAYAIADRQLPVWKRAAKFAKGLVTAKPDPLAEAH